MDGQITFEYFCKLKQKSEKNEIKMFDKIKAMENKKDLLKKYTSFYLTLNNWLNKK